MAIDHFPTKSQAWLEARLDELATQEVAGKIATSSGAADINASFSVESGSAIVRRKLLESLMVKDPTGGWDAYLPSRVTKALFNDAIDC